VNREQLLLALDEPPRPGEDIAAIQADARAEAHSVLRRAKAAVGQAPWDQREQRYWRTVFPQMARWLPDWEQASIVDEFLAELDRIDRQSLAETAP
jgi:hypothetical protein